MRLENIEGHSRFNCSPDWQQARAPGLSALVRLHNEAAWIRCCLESCVEWFDEIVVCLNRCTDDTRHIVEAFRQQHPGKFKVFGYPFEIYPMGPGHDRCPADSVHSSAYFYNYTQSRITRTHCCKVDGDMVFQDWAGAEIRRLMAEGHDRIKFGGVDLVGDDVAHIGCHPRCPTNGVYPIRAGTHYAQGAVTQNLKGVREPTAVIEKPCFLHMKWARKDEASATVQWPDNWREVPHFQRIYERRIPVAPYDGEYPASMRRLLKIGGAQ